MTTQSNMSREANSLEFLRKVMRPDLTVGRILGFVKAESSAIKFPCSLYRKGVHSLLVEAQSV